MVRAYAAKSKGSQLEPFEYEPGPLGDHEVEVKVSHCGICHSDLAMIDNDWGFSTYPLVPGHEVVGEIVAVGRDVKHRKVGERVGVGWFAGSCGHCEWCVRAKEMFCAQGVGTIVGRPGGWATTVRAEAKFAIPIPDALDSAGAAPLLCAGTTVYTPMAHYGVRPGMKTAVVGIGGLGHLAVQFLHHFGCEVTAISTSHAKDEDTRKLGAHHFIATRGTDELAKAANSFDYIVSTLAVDVAWPEYVAALRPQGRLVLVGVPPGEVHTSVFSLIAEKSISGGESGSPTDTQDMLQFAADHRIKAQVEVFPMSDVNKAVQHVRDNKARFRVVLESDF